MQQICLLAQKGSVHFIKYTYNKIYHLSCAIIVNGTVFHIYLLLKINLYSTLIVSVTCTALKLFFL